MGRRLLEGTGRELQLSGEGKETFLPNEGWQQQGKEGVGGLTGSRAVQRHEVWVPPAQPHILNTAPARRLHLFSGRWGIRTADISFSRGRLRKCCQWRQEQNHQNLS